MKKVYEGSVYIGVAGSEDYHYECRDSIRGILRRAGDGEVVFGVATKGYECRQMHINKFMESKHDFILLLDHDMIFPQDTLERLRSHKLPYVSGQYMRRHISPIASVWFENFNVKNPVFPMKPWIGEDGGLIKIGASGWGCILLHREVIEATNVILKGEDEVIEDDMDVWPYDLWSIMKCINGLDLLLQIENLEDVREAVENYVSVLKAQLRPLRGQNSVVGSDIRFPFYAKAAGYQLWGDTEVGCGHIIKYSLTKEDFYSQGEENLGEFKKFNTRNVNKERKNIREHLEKLNGSN